MNISILDNDAARTYLEYSNLDILEWQKSQRRNVRNFGLLSALLIVIDVLTFSDHTFSATVNGEIKYFDLHLTLGMGIAFLLNAIRLAIGVANYKKKFLAETQKICTRYYGSHNYRKIFITDQSIKSESEISMREMGWSAVTSYMIFQDALCIILDSRMDTSIVIPQRLLKDPEYTELLSYLKRHKPETKDFAKPV